MLAYGFWNAKNIRIWAAAAGEIKVQNDKMLADNNTETRLNAERGKSMEELKNDLAGFSSDLDSIAKETASSREKTKNLSRPRGIGTIDQEMDEYYGRAEEKIGGLSNIIKFMNQFIGALDTFDKIGNETTLDEIKLMLTDAKSKSSEMKTSQLPAETIASGNELKAELESFFEMMQNRIDGKIGTGEQANLLSVNSSQFSQRESNFISDIKKYDASFQDLDALQKKINNDLLVLAKVKFSVK